MLPGIGDDAAVGAFPCPCCGHLTLEQGPGAYELCPVCYWEDDGGQLRYPTSSDGANGISLVEAQQNHGRLGAVHKRFKSKVRPPRANEPLDPGWRPCDSELDWTDPRLESDRWPVNPEALYYWRPTYWNGEQHKLPLPAREPTNDDRFLQHLRAEVPELDAAVAAAEVRWGRTSAFEMCKAAARLALDGYEAGEAQPGLRIATAMLPGLDEGSPMYLPNAVVIAFLENERWHAPGIQHFIDQWPALIRDELREQQQHVRAHRSRRTQREAEWHELHRTGHGQPIEDIAERLRSLSAGQHDFPDEELRHQLTARVISNRHWLYRHPVDSIRLAWTYLSVRKPWKTLRWLNRPRWIG